MRFNSIEPLATKPCCFDRSTQFSGPLGLGIFRSRERHKIGSVKPESPNSEAVADGPFGRRYHIRHTILYVRK